MQLDIFMRGIKSTVLGNGETVYSVMNIINALHDLDEELCASDVGAIFVPQYIANNRRMELYWFNLEIDDEHTRETVLLSRTGKKNISEISQEVLALADLCYLTVCPPHRTISKLSMLQYFNELLNREEIIEGIKQRFGFYDPANMYISVF